MKVLLVYPEFPDTYWSFKHALRFLGKRSAFPPLGLLTVAAMLPANWEKRLVDLNVRPLHDSDLDWADVVFLSGMMVQGPSMQEQIARARSHGKRTVVGGPIVSSQDPSVNGADHQVAGEAEEIMPELIRDLERGEARPFYKSEQLPDLKVSPLPQLSLADLRRYSSMSVQFSRGCPFTCEFCDIIEIYGRRPRTKAPGQILAELDQLHRLGWRGRVFLVDDNFIGNKNCVKALLPPLAEWMRARHYPFSFITEASLNLADDEELLNGMREAGFTSAFLGIETPVAESLKEATKFQNLRQDLLSSVRRIQAKGIEVMGGFIVGFDNDPPDVFERQIRFIREAAIPVSMVGLLTALPNTQLWRRLKTEGRLLKQSIGNNTLADLNFIPRMDAQKLLEGYRRVMQTVYSPREYFERASASLAQLGTGARTPLVFTDFLAALRSLWGQGLQSNYRWEYWKFLLRAARQRRQRWGKVFSLAIMGHHFFEFAQAQENG